MWSLRVIVFPGIEDAVMSKMIVQTYLMLLEAMYPNRFPAVGLFQPKIGQNGDFLRKNREFSMWRLRVIVSPGIEDAVMSKMMARTYLMLLEAMYRNRFQAVGLFQPKNGQNGNFIMKDGEFSMWSLHVIVSPGIEDAVMSKMMGWTYLMLLEAMYPNSFQAVGLFQPKNGQNGNFIMKDGEFSMWSLHVLVSSGVEEAVVSKTMGRSYLMLLEAMYPNRFSSVGLF